MVTEQTAASFSVMQARAVESAAVEVESSRWALRLRCAGHPGQMKRRGVAAGGLAPSVHS